MNVIVLSLFLFPFANSEPKSKLLVVSFGGFRSDYLDWGYTPKLNSLRTSSTYARSLLPIFPSQKFPNLWTIATGVYPNAHCVLGSQVYDKKRNLLLTDGYDLWHHNRHLTQIWRENEDGGPGRFSGVMMWPGAEHVESDDTSPTFVTKSDPSTAWSQRVDEMMTWFKHPTTPANLVMAHFEQPVELENSFSTEQIVEHVKRVDATVDHLLTRLNQHGLNGEVNLVLLGDHGTLDVPSKNVIDLTSVVGNMARIYGESPVLQVYPVESNNIDLEIVVYETLKEKSTKNKNFKVYLKKDIPDHFHVRNCELIPPILVVAEPHYAFQDLLKNKMKCENNEIDPAKCVLAVSGYDPQVEAMQPFFIAHGPVFRKKHFVYQLRSIDMFPLFSHILGLDAPTLLRDGSLDQVKDILIAKEPVEPSCSSYSWLDSERYFCYVKQGFTRVVSFISSFVS